MQRETSNDTFLDYGSVYHQPIDREHPELIHQTMVAITRRYVSQFYCFNCDTYLQVRAALAFCWSPTRRRLPMCRSLR